MVKSLHQVELDGVEKKAAGPNPSPGWGALGLKPRGDCIEAGVLCPEPGPPHSQKKLIPLLQNDKHPPTGRITSGKKILGLQRELN